MSKYLKKRRREHDDGAEGDAEGDGEGDGDEKAWTWIEDSYLLRITEGIAKAATTGTSDFDQTFIRHLITDELPNRDSGAVLRRVSELQLGKCPEAARHAKASRPRSCLLCGV